MQKSIPPAKCGEGLFIANSEEKYRKRNGGNSMQSNCETCMYFGYDEEFEEYFCEVNLDEDEMENFSRTAFKEAVPITVWRMNTGRCVSRCKERVETIKIVSTLFSV